MHWAWRDWGEVWAQFHFNFLIFTNVHCKSRATQPDRTIQPRLHLSFSCPLSRLTSQQASATVRHFAWRHVRCASKYATITIFKGICQFILMAAIKVNYSRRQNVQRRRRRRWRRWRRWRQGYSLVPAQKCRVGAESGRAPTTTAALPCCGVGRQRPIRHNTLDLPGLGSTLCMCVCVGADRV